MYLKDLSHASTGEGVSAYGGRLEAYLFEDKDVELLIEQLTVEIECAIGRRYLPIYRMADGEYRFLFGVPFSWSSFRNFREVARYVKYTIFRRPWRTSWGEGYSNAELERLRMSLVGYLTSIASQGKLALYWNENGIDAFTEFNDELLKRFHGMGITLNSLNYTPFHVCIGAIAKNFSRLVRRRHVVFVSGADLEEQQALEKRVLALGARSFSFVQCSKSGSLVSGLGSDIPHDSDICFVAAGIGAARIIYDLRYRCLPVIDIGSLIHVISGYKPECHGGFFREIK